MGRERGRVSVARVYDQPDPSQGRRVLVDRLWPRGLAKERAALDEWCKEIAPSDELRRWYGHKPDRFAEFSKRYRAELRKGEAAAALQRLAAESRSEPVALLTATKDLPHSNAAVIAARIEEDRG